MPTPTSERLVYELLSVEHEQTFHLLVTDAHIRRYLLDGERMDSDWCRAEIDRARALLKSRGVGLWLIRERADGPVVGFAGFRVFESLGDEPQLLYALVESVTGKGYATEAARAAIEVATRDAGFSRILAAVDEPNRASQRVLGKLGFKRCGNVPGVFGQTFLYELEAR